MDNTIKIIQVPKSEAEDIQLGEDIEEEIESMSAISY